MGKTGWRLMRWLYRWTTGSVSLSSSDVSDWDGPELMRPGARELVRRPSSSIAKLNPIRPCASSSPSAAATFWTLGQLVTPHRRSSSLLPWTEVSINISTFQKLIGSSTVPFHCAIGLCAARMVCPQQHVNAPSMRSI